MPNDNNQTNSASTNGDNNQPTAQSNMPPMPSSFQSGTANVQADVKPPQQTTPPTPSLTNIQTDSTFSQPTVTPTQNPVNTLIQDASVGKNQSPNVGDISTVITSEHVPERLGGRKAIATIFGILFLVGGIVAGVFLAQRRQEIRERAAGFTPVNCPIESAENRIIVQFDGHLIRSDQSEDKATLGSVGTNISPGNYNITLVSYEKDKGGQPNESWFLRFNDSYGNNFAQTSPISDMPATENWLTEVVNENFTLAQEVGFITAFHAAYPDTSSPNSINPVCAVFDRVTTQIGASCSTVQAYDDNWNFLSNSDLSTLGIGNIVRFTVSGTTTSGVIDKAKFVANGISLGETTIKKPGTDEFYVEYTIPEGVVNFTIDAQIHHTQLGWF